MKNKKGSNLVNDLALKGLLLALIIVFGVYLYIDLNSVLSQSHNSSSIVKDNPSNNSKSYQNTSDGFNFEYPASYNLDEKKQEGNTLLDLEKDSKLDQDGYYLVKGSWIRITFKKDLKSFIQYVQEENKRVVEKNEAGIEERNINGIEALEVNYHNTYSHPLKIAGIKKVYLKNNNDVLELSLQVGRETTKVEYETYIKEFDSVVNSVKFGN